MASFKAPSIIPSRKKVPVPTASPEAEISQQGGSANEVADNESTNAVEHQPPTGDTVPAEEKETVTGTEGGKGERGGGGEGGEANVKGREEGEGGDEERENEGNEESEVQTKSEGVCDDSESAGNETNQGVIKEADTSNGDQSNSSGVGTRVVSGGPPPPTPELPYTEPHWSGPPSQSYSLTVIKSGSVLEEIDISNKPFLVFGRLPVCDVPLEHPSISRYHAVLQYRPTSAPTTEDQGEGGGPLSFGTPNETGFYVYDLGSTHGSFLNKSKLQPRVYYKVRVGQMVKFGGSSRLFVLEVGGAGGGGEEGQERVEAEAEAEIQELRRLKEEMEARQRRREEERERLAREREEMGATWGMVMDEIARRENEEEEEEEVTIDPEREAYYKEDPKKALKKYFDREGLELEYEVEEEGSGRDKTYIARVTLPIESGGGQVVVEDSVRGRKKDAVFQCALKACHILDSNDMLRAASQRRQRVTKNWEENDYYDSDEDSFLDRTGELEQKRHQRMKRLGKLKDRAESYDSLVKKLEEVTRERQGIEAKLNKSKSAQGEGGKGDSLDQYMSVVSSQLDPATITRLKRQNLLLKKEEEMIRKVMKVAKPTEMPSLQPSDTTLVRREEEGLGASTSSGGTREGQDGGRGGGGDGSKEESGGGPTSSGGSTQLPVSGTTAGSVSPTALAAGGGGDSGAVPPPSRSSRRRRRRSSSSSGPEASGGGGEGAQKRSRMLGPTLPPLPQRDEQQKKVSETADPEFASWLPPEDQTGDGRTHLNDKFGY